MPLMKSSDIAPGDIVPVEADGLQLLVVADYDGSVYCVANVCPHLGTPLDQGTIGDGTIVCPLHKSAFSLESGELVGDWCPFPPVRPHTHTHTHTPTHVNGCCLVCVAGAGPPGPRQAAAP